MALKKCRECGEQISTKAEACPKCGAKMPKRTSFFTWLVLFFIVIAVYSVSRSRTSPSINELSNEASTEIVNANTESNNVEAPQPVWTTIISTDEMTKKVSAYAISPSVYPSRRMSFPYSDVNAWLGVGCDGSNEWAFIGFNSDPNLANTQTEDGYNLIRTRIKWGEKIENIVLTQDWSSKFIDFKKDKVAIANISDNVSSLLELQWHGEQSVYFQFSHNGATSAIADMRNKCKKA